MLNWRYAPPLEDKMSSFGRADLSVKAVQDLQNVLVNMSLHALTLQNSEDHCTCHAGPYLYSVHNDHKDVVLT